MKNFFKSLIFSFLIIIFAFPTLAQEEKLQLHFFYGDGCPHCAKEEKFLDKLKEEFPQININYYEVWYQSDNAKLLKQVGQELNVKTSGVPLLVVGDKPFIGFHAEETTGQQIRQTVLTYLNNPCPDIVSNLNSPQAQQSCQHGCDLNDTECVHDCGCHADNVSAGDISEQISLPFLGTVKTKNISLPFLTIIIAAIDGFNPCAMWVLLFLISLLLSMQDRKKMWILGGLFIFASSLVYFLFLAAWLNLFLFVGFVHWLRVLIAVVALYSGYYHIKEHFLNKDGGCNVTDSQKRKKIFERLKDVVNKKSFLLSVFGIIMLAAAVNLVELLCSAGLPAVYTQILSLANLPTWQYYMYLVLYIIIFMLDDMLVYFIAMLLT